MSRISTTHTVDMAQIAEINQHLATLPSGAPVTAADLGLDGAALHRKRSEPSTLAGSAVLVRLSWDGAPEFPYIHGHFSSTVGASDQMVLDLHTPALVKLSHQLHLHHVWGQGSIP